MATLKDTLASIDGWLKNITDLGISIILAFVIIDILFPGTTGVVKNIGELVGGLAKEGAVGLIALLVFLLIYKR
ncbi:MAG: hypothetical protein GY864_07885 [Desulfobacterales bacterium]|nr:hypothetical protein [Desulfobacterales bacterium]